MAHLGLGGPIRLLADGRTKREGPHLLPGALGALLVVTEIGGAALAFRTRFRYYSLATIVVTVLVRRLGMKDAGRIEAGLATPWVGVIERVSFYGWHVWFLVLAFAVRRDEPTRRAHTPWLSRARASIRALHLS